ncbi:MAG TPA: acyl-ACP--UDP-N-acetylglucosamine O-acyltransferase [Thermoanaerobaculia bacterium]|nr:acyl-ACP--UDP-N-acetylglucosamine O-acyltransferase [Thermoanaerobaculia bacterium]
MSDIHPTAHVDPAAELGSGVRVGAFAVIGPRVVLGDGCEVGAQAQVQGPSRFGRDNRIFPHACVGFEPQDLKYKGEDVFLEVGDRNHFREFSTVHRGTAGGGALTRIGDDNLFMAYSHVAHDSHVGSRTVFVNGATLAGHVLVEDDVTIGAFSAVHQFCRVGRHAYVGGYTVVTMDALPFVKTVGMKATCYGLNTIGLRRKGLGRDTIRRLDHALRLLVYSGLNTRQALERIAAEVDDDPEVRHLVEFVQDAKRGFVKTVPGRRGERGAGAAGTSGEEAPVVAEGDDGRR